MAHFLKHPKIKNPLLYLISFCLAILLYVLLSTYNISKDITQNQKNTLSETTLSLLESFESHIQVTLYTEDYDLKLSILFWLSLYSKHSSHFVFEHKTTPVLPENQKVLGFQTNGLTLQYQGKTQTIDLNQEDFNESTFSQALFKLKRAQTQWVVFLEGHGEPNPFGEENQDLSFLTNTLESQGLKIQTLNLATFGSIPDNTTLLILAAPKTALMPGEEALIKQYIEANKNFLWLMGQDQDFELTTLQSLFHIKKLPGVVVDLHGQKMGTPHPAISLVTQYPATPVTHKLSELTAFPWATALESTEDSPWKIQKFLKTHENTWTATGPLTEQIHFAPEKGEVAGPLTLGILLTQKKTQNQSQNKEPLEQRISIIGNTQFLSNGAIQNYGNLNLGLNLINWLSEDDALLSLTPPKVSQQIVSLTYPIALSLQYLYPYGLPIILLGAGLFTRFYRNRISTKMLYRMRAK